MPSKFLPTNIFQGLLIGDEETYIFLFREYYTILCSYARRYVGRKDIAEEIVSETFLKIWENRSLIKINSSVKAYLFQAVCNNSLNYLRKHKNDNTICTFFRDTSFENLVFEEPEEEFEEKSLRMANFTVKIGEVVDLLPEQQRRAFRLKRYEGKKIREIAEIMGLSAKTVEMHLSKATHNLRQALKDCLPSFLLFIWLN
jgi:RNA polymerase sigma-70 factor (ECF subfamily)